MWRFLNILTSCVLGLTWGIFGPGGTVTLQFVSGTMGFAITFKGSDPGHCPTWTPCEAW